MRKILVLANIPLSGKRTNVVNLIRVYLFVGLIF